MKKFSYKKIIAVLLVVVTIMTSLNLNEVNAAVSNTTIDVTGLATGDKTSHDCNKYLQTKYNSSQHWQQCTVCGAVYGSKTNHSYSEYWTMGNSCSSYNKLIHTCSCGYSYSTNNTRSHILYSTLSSNLRYHVKLCSVCKKEIQEWGLHCDSNGNTLTCQNQGVCAICGRIVNYHECVMGNRDGALSDGTCTICGNNGINLSGCTSSVTWNNTTFTVTTKIYIPNAYSNVSWDNASFDVSQYGTITSCNSTYDTTNKIITTTFTGYYTENIEDNNQAITYRVHYYDANGKKWDICVWNRITPEKTAPTINAPTQTNISTSLDGWVTNKQLTFTGTENYCGSVKLTLKDSYGNVYLNNVSVNVSNKAWTYSCTPKIEADANGKTFTLTATDTLGNSSSKSFVVYKTDKKTPVLTSSDATSTEWSKTKDYIASATDEGSGNVQIAFNNTNNYGNTDKNGTSYSRPYTFTGDVYGSVKAAIYLKDAVGNETTQFITISNLDNTAPTITDVSKKLTSTTEKTTSAKLTVTANDINTALNASGSGVNGYAITTTNQAPSLDKFQTSNTFTVTSNGKYYLWAKDAVGNISTSPKTIDVKDITTSISGTITWVDNNNSLYLRPDTAKISLLRNGEEIQTVDTADIFEFINLPTTDDNYNPYTYELKETINAKVIVDNKIKDAYDISLNKYDFTNTLMPYDNVIPVYPEKNNSLTITHNLNKEISVTLKQITQSYDKEGNISYGTDYNGYYYNSMVNTDGITLNGINNGKYEIDVTDTGITLNNVTVNNNKVSVLQENGKYYIIIPLLKDDISATVTLDLSEKQEKGYISNSNINNFFKIK